MGRKEVKGGKAGVIANRAPAATRKLGAEKRHRRRKDRKG